jgi:hypothetical protein
MRKKTFIYCIILMLVYFSNVFSQYNKQIFSGVAPFAPGSRSYNANSIFTNPNSLGYSYYAAGTSSSQLVKYNVGTPGNTTLIGSPQPYLLGNGDFANPTGVWKFYVQDQNAPYTIYEVDTATGNLTGIGAPANIKNGHIPTDLEWDQTTGYFYMISSDISLTETQIYRVYWPTLYLTWIGTAATMPSAIIAGGFNANGTYFGIDLLSDGLWKVNKNTGVWTMVGLLGYPVNYSQDAGFARPDYSRMLWCACGGTVGLYEIDTSNAGINLIGTFPSYLQVVASGFVGGQDGPQITVTPYPNTQNVTGPYIINAVVMPGGSVIASTKIFWSRNNPVITDSVTMTNSGGNNWTGNIPGNGTSSTYRYYCITKDLLGRTASAPLGAPANLYTFVTLANDTSKPVITHTPIGSTLKTVWPVYVNATVTDNLGIDSVWVNWKINYNGTAKHFRLPVFNGNIYQSLFNSVNSDVNAGDSVFYRIIAQDNSAAHNRDSTTTYSFRIIGTEVSCIGSGSSSTSTYPFNALYWGNRSQMLYTANEIQALGGGAGNIMRIGFYITSVDTNTMNNFSVKVQSITDTVLSPPFVENNWTTVYSGTFAFTATGMQYINFQTPFQWDGNGSVLIQICFENTMKHFYTSERINITTSNKVLYEHHDNLNACTAFQNPTTWFVRPNICFGIMPLVNADPFAGLIPVKYKLSQNYPNPFNPSTRISYEIPGKSMVTLKIYDMLGKELRTLVNETKDAGKYSVDFNASALPSGIYFSVLRANSFCETKKMVLIK